MSGRLKNHLQEPHLITLSKAGAKAEGVRLRSLSQAMLGMEELCAEKPTYADMCGGSDVNIPSDESSSICPVPLVLEMSSDIKELKMKS